MASNPKHYLSSSFSSFIDYTFTDDSDSSYTIDDISLVLDPPNTTATSKTTTDTLNRTRRSRIKYGGSGRRQAKQTAANDSSVFCEVTPLPTKKGVEERISDSIISIDDDISYDDSYLREKLPRTDVQPGCANTDRFRRFSPRRVAVKLMPTSKRVQKRWSGITKTRSTPQRQNGLVKFLFLGKYGCLNKVLD